MRIVVVEDNPSDVLLLREALNEHIGDYDLHVLQDGAQAMAYIEQTSSHPERNHPDFFVIDLNLPRYHGLEILKRLKEHGTLKRIPAVILTSSSAADERRESERLGAACFLTKPGNLDAFIALGLTLKECYEAAVRRKRPSPPRR